MLDTINPETTSILFLKQFTQGRILLVPSRQRILFSSLLPSFPIDDKIWYDTTQRNKERYLHTDTLSPPLSVTISLI